MRKHSHGDGFDYGKRYIGASLSNRLGESFPRKRLPEPVHEKQMTDITQISTDALKMVFTKTADWRDMLDAADELGRRVERLDDVEALGDIVRFCQGEDERKTAMEKLAMSLPRVKDPRVLEAIVMNSEDDNARRDAIEILGRRTDDVTSTFTLVHIALCAKHKYARFAAVNKLIGKADALNVVAQHSEFEDTRDYAKGRLAPDGGLGNRKDSA